MPFDEMVAEFRIEDVNQSPAFFDVKKLRAFNGEYIRALSEAEFSAACQPVARRRRTRRGRAEPFDQAVFAQLAPLAQTRIALLVGDHRHGGLRVPATSRPRTRRPGTRR